LACWPLGADHVDRRIRLGSGTSSSTRRLGAAVLGLLHSHVELFGIELQEQKARTVSLLLFAGLALVFALLLLVGLSTLVLILFWDTYRLAGSSACACSTPWPPLSAGCA
jgi:uncharacterized membrane protein YqjE